MATGQPTKEKMEALEEEIARATGLTRVQLNEPISWLPEESSFKITTTIDGEEVELKNVSIESENNNVRITLPEQEKSCLNCGRESGMELCLDACEEPDYPHWLPKPTAEEMREMIDIQRSPSVDHNEQFYMSVIPHNSFRFDRGGWKVIGRSRSTSIHLQHIKVRETSINAIRYRVKDEEDITIQRVEIGHMAICDVDWDYPLEYFHNEYFVVPEEGQAAESPLSDAMSFSWDGYTTAGDYGQAIEAMRTHVMVQNPRELEGEIQPTLYIALGHGNFVEDVIQIRNLLHGVVISARIQEEIHIGDRGMVMTVEGTPYFCKLREQDIPDFSDWQREGVRTSFNLQGHRNVMQLEDDRADLTQRVYEYNDESKPKPTEQELLQWKVDDLLEMIEEQNDMVKIYEGDIAKKRQMIKERIEWVESLQGKLELLTHNLSTDEHSHLVPGEPEDCPFTTVTSLPTLRKWWQFWKPKIIPGVELVL